MARIAAIEHPNILPTVRLSTDRRQLPVRDAPHGHDAARGDRQAQPDAARAHQAPRAGARGARRAPRRAPHPPRLHAAQHPRRRGRERRLPVRLRPGDVDRRPRRADLPHLLQGPDLRLARLVGRPRDDRPGPDGLDHQHVARHLRDRRRAARAVHRAAALRPGRRYVGPADPDRRGRRGRRAQQGALPRTASRRRCAA